VNNAAIKRRLNVSVRDCLKRLGVLNNCEEHSRNEGKGCVDLPFLKLSIRGGVGE
jgi:hypothetical protein